jgi:hypothetical protein
MEPLTQPDYLDGKVVQLPDTDGVVDLEENGTIYRCTVSAEVNERLRPYLNGPTIRGFGTAKWLREPDGQWVLQAFSIENFTPLDDRPLDQVLK